jgi:hypothetical protein
MAPLSLALYFFPPKKYSNTFKGLFLFTIEELELLRAELLCLAGDTCL